MLFECIYRFTIGSKLKKGAVETYILPQVTHNTTLEVI
jgi:hypothetical protein